MKLYELPAAFANLEMFTNDDGEIAPESLEALATLEMALEDKVDACCRAEMHMVQTGSNGCGGASVAGAEFGVSVRRR